MVLCHQAYFAQKNIPFDGTVPLASYYVNNKPLQMKSPTFTEHIRNTARTSFLSTGISADDLMAHSLWTGGAMALFCCHCDIDQINYLACGTRTLCL